MKKAVVIIAIVSLFTSCITWYTGEVNLKEGEVVKFETLEGQTLHYAVEREGNFAVDRELARKLERSIIRSIKGTKLFSDTAKHKSLSDYAGYEKGSAPYFLSIKLYENTAGAGATTWMVVDGLIFAWILPAYWQHNFDTEYTLYKYDSGSKSYRKVVSESYEAKRRTLFWLLNIPALWVNFLTHDREDVVSLSAKDFLKKYSKRFDKSGK